MEKIHLNAAGIDLGAKHVFSADDDGVVKNYRTFTADFHVPKKMISWLKA